MAKEVSNGLMVENMKEITKMIRNMVMVFFLGQTEESTKETGKTASNMAKVST